MLVGPQAINHAESASLNALARLISQLSNSRYGYLFDGGNIPGAWLAGAVPHRGVGGTAVSNKGLHAEAMLRQGLAGYLLLDVEPEIDSMNPVAAANALGQADFIVSLSLFDSGSVREYADVMLPVAPFTETSGTFVNAAGQWQSFAGVVAPRGETRPAWKVLRVLGNLFGCEGFEYVTSEEVLSEVRDNAGQLKVDNAMEIQCPAAIKPPTQDIVRIAELQMYAGDSLQRRATALQNTPDAQPAAIRVSKLLADRIGLQDGDTAKAKQNGNEVILPVVIDDRVSDGCVLIHAGLADSAKLDASLTPLTLTRA